MAWEFHCFCWLSAKAVWSPKHLLGGPPASLRRHAHRCLLPFIISAQPLEFLLLPFLCLARRAFPCLLT